MIKKGIYLLIISFCIMVTAVFAGCSCGDAVSGEWTLDKYYGISGDTTLSYTTEQAANLQYYSEVPEGASTQTKIEVYIAQIASIYGDAKLVFLNNKDLEFHLKDAISYNTYKLSGSNIEMSTQTPEGTQKTNLHYKDDIITFQNQFDDITIKITFKKK